MTTTLERTEHEGVETLFRSKSVAAILKYLTHRRLMSVRVAVLEQELLRQAGISRGAITHALDSLERAGLLRFVKDEGVLVGEIRAPKVWAKIGELFDVERGPEATEAKGMPWLADVVANKPRRVRLRSQPASTEPELPLEAVEAMFAKLPEAEVATSARRSPAPGRRR